VAIGSGRIAVGAPGEDSAATGLNGNQVDDTAPDSGAVYLFLYEVGAWWPDGYLKPSNTGTGDAFGTSVAVNVVLPGSQELFPLDFRLETVVVGAPGESSDSTVIDGDGANDNAPLSGAAYVYRNVFPFLGDEWGETYFKAPNADAGDQFGTAVAFVYGRLVVGAPVESSVAGGINGDAEDDSQLQAGAAYEFFDTGGEWLADAYIKATNTRAGDLFGTAVAIDNGWIAVGAIGQDGGVTGIDGNQAIFGVLESGAVYVYP